MTCSFNYTIRKLTLLLLCFIVVLVSGKAVAQQGQQMFRLAKIRVDPSQLEEYNTALKEQMNAAIKLEPGVLTYYALADKKEPSLITILEIYADTAAYQSHIQTPHFRKYKDTVKDMVMSLELIDMMLIATARKPGM